MNQQRTRSYFSLDHNVLLSASKFQLICLKRLVQSVMCAVCLDYPEKKKDSNDEEEREKSILYSMYITLTLVFKI